jgi:hypothetical protein
MGRTVIDLRVHLLERRSVRAGERDAAFVRARVGSAYRAEALAKGALALARIDPSGKFQNSAFESGVDIIQGKRHHELPAKVNWVPL